MPIPITVLQPQYVSRFRCLGTDCEDTCCEGMGVVIDRETYERYQACGDPELRPLMDSAIYVNPAPQREAAYATILHVLNACPFLDERRLCSIQNRLGPQFLSRACALYPRALNRVDGQLERSLYFSCPEAARLALFDPRPMAFEAAEDVLEERFRGFPELQTADRSDARKPYPHFRAIRHFILTLLQNRAYPFDERMILLGLFCAELDRLSSDLTAGRIPGMIESFAEGVAAGSFAETLATVTAQPGAQMALTVHALEYRLHTDSTWPRFAETYREFRRGLGVETEQPEASAARYEEAARTAFRSALSARPPIFEHYVVSAVFRTLFPLGPQESLYAASRSVFAEYTLLAVQYVLLRTLLTGAAAFYGPGLTDAVIVRVFQSFAKAVEHQLPYLQFLLDFLTENEMADLPFLAALVKDPA